MTANLNFGAKLARESEVSAPFPIRLFVVGRYGWSPIEVFKEYLLPTIAPSFLSKAKFFEGLQAVNERQP